MPNRGASGGPQGHPRRNYEGLVLFLTWCAGRRDIQKEKFEWLVPIFRQVPNRGASGGPQGHPRQIYKVMVNLLSRWFGQKLKFGIKYLAKVADYLAEPALFSQKWWILIRFWQTFSAKFWFRPKLKIVFRSHTTVMAKLQQPPVTSARTCRL